MGGDRIRIYEMNNGEKAFSPFSPTEMDSRQAKLRALMADRGIDACLFTSYHNICYYSGFLYCAFGRKYGFLVTQDRATTIAAGIDGGQPWRRTHGEAVIYSDWRRDNYVHAVQSLLAWPNPAIRRIGIEFDHVSLDLLKILEAAFPGVAFADIAADAMSQRTIKSAEELALIREGARICDVGGGAVAGAVKAGVREHEVAIASTNAMICEIAKSFPFVELMDTWTWFQSGINTDGAHNPVTNKVVEAGDILSLNCFPMIFGYYTALERTLFCGHAGDDHLRHWEINCHVHREGLKMIRPGARCCDIAAELNEIYRSHDLLKHRSFGYGHSFGVLSHYYGREASVELREDVETVLQPGMVVSMEPMIMIPEGLPGAGGYREHDILIVTDEAADNITGFPFGPEHNIL